MGYSDGRAMGGKSAADTLEDMLAKGDSPELMLRVFRSIARDARQYADRVNPQSDVTVTR